jgi:hypothetical protein
MKRWFICVGLLLTLLSAVIPGVTAQTPPQVDIVMSANEAGQNQVIYADVYVRSDDTIVGADIGIEVGPCLRVEARENGRYLPTTAEANGFVPFEELTETGTRLAANVLGQDTVAQPGEYFFRASLRVLCDSGQAEVRVSFAQIVNRDLESYKLSEGQIVVTNGTVTMGPGQPEVATAMIYPTSTEFPTPAAVTETPEVVTTPTTTQNNNDNLDTLLIGIIAALVIVVLLLAVLLIRRSKA